MDPMTPRPVSPGVRGYSYGVSLGELGVWLETTFRFLFGVTRRILLRWFVSGNHLWASYVTHDELI